MFLLINTWLVQASLDASTQRLTLKSSKEVESVSESERELNRDSI